MGICVFFHINSYCLFLVFPPDSYGCFYHVLFSSAPIRFPAVRVRQEIHRLFHVLCCSPGWHGDCSLSNKQTIILKGTNSTTGSKWNLRVLRVWTHWMPAAEKSFLMAMWAIMIDRINIKFKCSIFARFICMHIKIHMKIYTTCSIFLDCVVSPTKKSTHQELILKKKNFGGSFLLLFSFF